MTTIQNTKSIQNSKLKYHNVTKDTNLLSSTQRYQQLSDSDSEAEENQLIVDTLFGTSTKGIFYDTEEEEHEEDEDIKRFLEQQIPGLYSDNQEDKQNYQPEQEHNIQVSFNNSITPEYFTMSRFQKQNFFENLNAVYMTKMRISQPSLLKDAQQNNRQKARKPAIKFNQIVFEVPFNKEQQPLAVKGTPEQLAYLVFDDDAYDCSSEQLQNGKDELIIMNQTSLYFDEAEEEEAQYLREEMIGSYCKRRLCFMEQIDRSGLDNVIFTGSDSEDEDGSSSQSQEQLISNNKTSSPQTHELLNQNRKWKRNAERQFIGDLDDNSQSDQSSSSSDSSDSSSNSSQNLIQLESDQKEDQLLSALEDQFLEGIQGRKINPNTLSSLNQTTTIQQMENNQNQNQSQNQNQPENIVTELIPSAKPIQNF